MVKMFIFIFNWYYDQKITFTFSSDFETTFTKHPPSKILNLNFEKKTVYLNCNFPFQWFAIITPERVNEFHRKTRTVNFLKKLLNNLQHETLKPQTYRLSVDSRSMLGRYLADGSPRDH